MPRILILDDEPELVKHLAKVLKSAGYECLTTVDGVEALEILNREQVDLLIQDCQRPEPDGLQLYEILKEYPSLRRIPVLFFSAGMGPEETAELRSAYGDEHLQKPATQQELLAAIEALLKLNNPFSSP